MWCIRFATSLHDFDLKLTIAVDLLSMAAEKQLQLFGLYVSQGAPYGFQANVLPILFRDWGKSYNSNGLLYLSYLPWVMKPLAAPFLEKSNLSSVSKTLIISAIIQIMIAYAVMQKSSNSLIILYLISNTFTALYDILVDKLAIQQRSESEIDTANVFQVVGYKIGSLLSGSFIQLLVIQYFSADFRALVLSPLVASVTFLIMAIWTNRSHHLSESSKLLHEAANSHQPDQSTLAAEKPHRAAYGMIWKHFCKHSAIYALLFTYKAGEQIGDSLFKTFLRDSGFNVAALSGSALLNDAVSIAGSLVMVGRAKKDRGSRGDINQLRWFLLLNIIPQCLRALVVWNKSAQEFVLVTAITIVENFIGGAVTVACFNFMFSHVLPDIEGTHYAVYASLEALGKIIVGASANFAVEQTGFRQVFVAAVALSLVPLLLSYSRSIQHTKQADISNKIF